jgi:hypothetical protein
VICVRPRSCVLHCAHAWYSGYSLVRGRSLLRCTVFSVCMLFNTRNVHYMNIRTFLWLVWRTRPLRFSIPISLLPCVRLPLLERSPKSRYFARKSRLHRNSSCNNKFTFSICYIILYYVIQSNLVNQWCICLYTINKNLKRILKQQTILNRINH